MSQDLSQAFGRPATSSLRGLLPPRQRDARWSEQRVDEGAPDAGVAGDLDEIDDVEDGELVDEDVEPDDLEDAEPDDTEPDDESAAPAVASTAPAGREERPRSARRLTTAGRTTASGTDHPRGRLRVTGRDHVDLLVLLALCQGPADGRGLIARLRETSDGVLEAPEQTIYPTLHRLARNRLLGRVRDPASGRRLYALTEAGERAARARLRRWHVLTRGVDAVARAGK